MAYQETISRNVFLHIGDHYMINVHHQYIIEIYTISFSFNAQWIYKIRISMWD